MNMHVRFKHVLIYNKFPINSSIKCLLDLLLTLLLNNLLSRNFALHSTSNRELVTSFTLYTSLAHGGLGQTY
jgi:hypothetical protein